MKKDTSQELATVIERSMSKRLGPINEKEVAEDVIAYLKKEGACFKRDCKGGLTEKNRPQKGAR